jgi:hypothetical protein
MVKYTIMKRITQLLASILFVIIVLTVYLGFDFVINTAMANKHSSDKHNHHDHVHGDNIKFEKKPPSLLSSSELKKPNRTIQHNDDEHDDIINHERRTRSVKQNKLHGKLSQFHKSKTGVKINHVKNSAKEQRKRLSASAKSVQVKNINDRRDV